MPPPQPGDVGPRQHRRPLRHTLRRVAISVARNME
jgi:hypothetical protein